MFGEARRERRCQSPELALLVDDDVELVEDDSDDDDSDELEEPDSELLFVEPARLSVL